MGSVRRPPRLDPWPLRREWIGADNYFTAAFAANSCEGVHSEVDLEKSPLGWGHQQPDYTYASILS